MAKVYFDIGGTPKLTSSSEHHILEYQTFNLGQGDYQVDYQSTDEQFTPQAESIFFSAGEVEIELQGHTFILNR